MIRLKSLVCGYGSFEVTRPIDLELESGEVLVIHGPNGSGKTTLLKTLAGLLKPIRGEAILVDGSSGRERPLSKTPSETILLPERVEVPERLTVKDYVEVFASLYRLRRSELRGRLEKALELLRLSKFADARLGHLSQGMKRRAMLLVPLVLKRPVNLLDDPLVAVDREVASEFFPSLLSQLSENGAVIASFRDIDEELRGLLESGQGYTVRYLNFKKISKVV